MDKFFGSCKAALSKARTSYGSSRGSKHEKVPGSLSILESKGGHQSAPHPIPKGMEGQPCPITGVFADEAEKKSSAMIALAALEADPDIADEKLKMKKMLSEHGAAHEINAIPKQLSPMRMIRLNVVNGKHHSSSDTRELLRSIGGLPVLIRFTNNFYEKAFADPHLDQFLVSHDEPHGERFATWIAEKLGDGTPWSDERRTRPRKVMRIGQEQVYVSYDRSSAHFAAWHSPKRKADVWGDHFKLDDARTWMRLHFWAARETGMFKHEAFMDYYIRFIAHFISIYSSKSPPFTRESAHWSADPQNVQQYLDAGKHMVDVVGIPLEQALAQLPSTERAYTGSRHSSPEWPYELHS
eukprot:gnl/MRDRNA2_/MRDRNA2_73481_c0_seq3.p1 gnl/MRDRNA2_/MRDRNA2_73481_c0~~gnl/MRDRNA2_/MRDRNA2_73481_c0_seq3.p1  ORF type:complete len:354 (-),score=60.21 gnl/MRDRNA2_/MRDRNA2_73481_c0_seq3:403-1464(-)